MARKFLYVVVAIILLVIAGLFALRIWGNDLTRLALVPREPFERQEPLAPNAYVSADMWFSRPGMGPDQDPSQFLPAGFTRAPVAGPAYAVFFVHPTSFLQPTHWNAPLDDAESQDTARTFLRGMASAFNAAPQLWAPRYRQATFGAMISDRPEAKLAVDAAYADVAQAFDQFVLSLPPDMPIVLAGHSQGALHVLRLLKDKVAGQPLQSRIAMAYPIGWPVSRNADLPALGLPACERADQGGCIASWASFAEPADPGMFMDVYKASPGLAGGPKDDSPILCVNPLDGTIDGSAGMERNLGTLVPDEGLGSARLVASAVPARCGEQGLLLIGDPPELGPYVLPGNNYHVYDVALFWANLRADVPRRVGAWAANR